MADKELDWLFITSNSFFVLAIFYIKLTILVVSYYHFKKSIKLNFHFNKKINQNELM